MHPENISLDILYRRLSLLQEYPSCSRLIYNYMHRYIFSACKNEKRGRGGEEGNN